DISEGLRNEIIKRARDLGVGLEEGMLLSLHRVLDETHRTVGQMIGDVGKLMHDVAVGSVPTREGMEELETLFQRAREEAKGVGDATTVAMLRAAQATGTMTDNMKAFVAEQQKLEEEGASEIAKGLGQMDLKPKGADQTTLDQMKAFGENAAMF